MTATCHSAPPVSQGVSELSSRYPVCLQSFFALYRLLELVVTRWTECMRYRRLFSARQT